MAAKRERRDLSGAQNVVRNGQDLFERSSHGGAAVVVGCRGISDVSEDRHEGCDVPDRSKHSALDHHVCSLGWQRQPFTARASKGEGMVQACSESSTPEKVLVQASSSDSKGSTGGGALLAGVAGAVDKDESWIVSASRRAAVEVGCAQGRARLLQAVIDAAHVHQIEIEKALNLEQAFRPSKLDGSVSIQR